METGTSLIWCFHQSTVNDLLTGVGGVTLLPVVLFVHRSLAFGMRISASIFPYTRAYFISRPYMRVPEGN